MYIVTGASGGIGRMLAKELSKTDLFIGTYFTHKIESDSDRLKYYPLDLTDEKSVERFILDIKPYLSKIILINLAGISIDGLTINYDIKDWDRTMAVNLRAIFLMSKAVLPYMFEEKWGRIINISSCVAFLGVPGTIAYAASKSALFGFTRTLAKECARHGVTVNNLQLGYFNVGLTKSIPGDVRNKIEGSIPLKRFGDVKDIIQAIYYIRDSDYLTGTEIQINGGLP